QRPDDALPPFPRSEWERDENRTFNGDEDHYHTVANPVRGEKPSERGVAAMKPTGYRPGRKTQKRRPGKKGGGPNPRSWRFVSNRSKRISRVGRLTSQVRAGPTNGGERHPLLGFGSPAAKLRLDQSPGGPDERVARPFRAGQGLTDRKRP